MSIAVTGGAGFVGLNLVEALLARGEEVVCISDRPIPPNAITAFASLPGRLTPVLADIRSTEDLSGLFRRNRVRRLFPFAAITPSPAREAADPEAVVTTNITAFIGQLRAARDAEVKRVIVPGSVAAYGESAFDQAPLREAETPCRPTTLYAITKLGAEVAALRLSELWGLDVVVARIGSVFGRWEHLSGARDTLGPHFRLYDLAARGITAVLPPAIPQSGSIYARDLAAALLHLSDLSDLPHRVFNVCTGENWSGKLPIWAECLREVFPDFAWRVAASAEGANLPLAEVRPRALMDVSRIRSTGWAPGFGPEAAYADYASWVRASGFTTAQAA